MRNRVKYLIYSFNYNFLKVSKESAKDVSELGELSLQIKRKGWTCLHDIVWNILSWGKLREWRLLNQEAEIIATAEVMPRVWLFNFMKVQDSIHIGPCWTNPLYRGNGFYPSLLKLIIFKTAFSRYYIFCNQENIASIRGIEKAGFHFIGYGYKTKYGVYRLLSKAL